MAKGFRRVLDSVADLRLDVPEAPQQIAAFIARAVADDILPPAFVEDISGGEQLTCSAETQTRKKDILLPFTLMGEVKAFEVLASETSFVRTSESEAQTMFCSSNAGVLYRPIRHLQLFAKRPLQRRQSGSIGLARGSVESSFVA